MFFAAALGAAGTPLGASPADIAMAFSFLDVDGSGLASPADLREAFAQLLTLAPAFALPAASFPAA